MAKKKGYPEILFAKKKTAKKTAAPAATKAARKKMK